MTKISKTYSYKGFVLILLMVILQSNGIFSQDSEVIRFESYLKSAKELNTLSLFSKSIFDLNKAIDISKRNNWEKEYLEANIFLGEMLRRSGDHKKGIEVLEKLANTNKYPLLHVNKLGRMAALYAEAGILKNINSKDSIKKFINVALKISKEKGFLIEEALLSNELGSFYLNGEKIKNKKHLLSKSKKAKPFFIRSSTIFKKLGDNNNYVLVMNFLLYIDLLEEKFEKADVLIKKLVLLSDNKEWYGTRQSLYRNIGNRYLTVGDSLNYLKWKTREYDMANKILIERTNNEMALLRVDYETNKFKNKAQIAEEETKRKSISLNWQRKLNLVLGLFIFIFLIASVVIYYLYNKKNRISKSLELSNKRFELLMIESNHRIKNNLQMILSMVDYSNVQSDTKEEKTLNKISGKIQTVGVLHKHLYTDVHNQFIKLETYFNEIIHLYTKMNPVNLIINSKIVDVDIESERIVYFGLILNEMLSNTIEHDLSEIKNVNIEISELNGNYQYLYSDNSPHLNIDKNKGSFLLLQLIARVKGKSFHLEERSGTYKFIFKDIE